MATTLVVVETEGAAGGLELADDAGQAAADAKEWSGVCGGMWCVCVMGNHLYAEVVEPRRRVKDVIPVAVRVVVRR